jgi:hypothetical protein
MEYLRSMRKRLTLTCCGLFAAAALLAACGASTPSVPTVPSAAHLRPRTGESWMSPLAKDTPKLLYVSGFNATYVDVYDYESGKQVGMLTGFSMPAGQCVDAKGDVYIANSGDGDVNEYAHGGKKPIKTYSTSGAALGCSVDKANDLAVSDFLTASYGPGAVTVFPKGSGKGIVYSNPNDCYDIWPGGYDGEGNLVMIAENATEAVTFCALLKGSKSLTTLTASGFTIYSPDSTMWDGKFIALGDQQLGGGFQSGIVEATLSGSTLTSQGDVTLSDDCKGDYTHVISPFIVGRKNTPVNDRQGTVVAGGNEFCNADFRLWHYPQGGNPFKTFTFQSGGQSVSIAD